MWTPDEIAELCYQRFEELPKRGKPEPGREWTLLAAVVQLTRVEKEVVSIGTGTKCIGRTAMSPRGDVLNDSHAEVIARRGCIRYLTEQLRLAVRGQGSSVFCRAEQQCGKWRLRPGVSFLFFTSHTPCGDASIIPMTDNECQPCPVLGAAETLKGAAKVIDGDGAPKRKAKSTSQDGNIKRSRLDSVQPEGSEGGGDCTNTSRALATSDVHRTGAKCVPGGPSDPHQSGAGYHSTGSTLRLKPGRGEPTLSLSCSDKLARWGVLGFQGALLSHYLQEAIYFIAVVVGKCAYSTEAMQRALVTRCSPVTGLPPGFSVWRPTLLQSNLEFPFSQARTQLQHQAGQGKVSPCGAAISWCNVPERPLDVTANGYKHGATKKALDTDKARSLLCKVELFHCFLSLVSATEPSCLPDSLREKELRSYWDYKWASESYQRAGRQLHIKAFPLWPHSDRSLLCFQ